MKFQTCGKCEVNILCLIGCLTSLLRTFIILYLNDDFLTQNYYDLVRLGVLLLTNQST